MKKLFIAPALAAVLTSLVGVDAVARPNVPNPNGGPTSSSFGRFQAAVCVQGTSKAELDINNVRAMVLNGGDMWWDLDNARYEVPKVEDPNGVKKHSIFAGAVWIGGVDASTNQLHLAAQTFRQGAPPDAGFWPGPLDATGAPADASCAMFDFHAKIDGQVVQDFIDFARTAPRPIPEESIPLAIKNWPGKGNPFRSNISDMGVTLAPFDERETGFEDGVYDPRQGDFPKIKGDQAIWWVMNDAAGVKQPVSPIIGLELQVQAFAFKAADLRNSMTFYEQTLINRGSKNLKDTYLAQWVDPDLGNYLDDYVGCDVTRGLGYVFNGDEIDEGVFGYGATPPALGVDFFAGPRSDANDGLDNDRDGEIDEIETIIDCETGDQSFSTEAIIMSNFVYYNNNFSTINGNPQYDTDFYNYMQSKWMNGNTIYFGGTGIPLLPGVPNESYKFMFPGNTDPLGYGYHKPVPNATPGQSYTPPYTFAGGAHVPFEWSEDKPGPGQEANAPSDRRFLQSAGPFTLSPGQVLPLTIGVVWARSTSGGRNGSLRLLTVADDAAQSLFDNCFKLPKGPNAPDLSITELDQELIISIIPDKYTLNGREINTEQYVELDRTLQQVPNTDSANPIDPYYRFQGYVVYQLKHPNVTQADLGNPDLARVVQAENGSGQSDVRDDLTILTNREFNVDLGDYVSIPQIIGENTGIRHTLRVKRDMFAQGESRLSNFKAYYYMAIAYASNPLNDADKFNSFAQYRSGIDNIQTYTAYPHKVVAESGMQLNAFSGQELDVTRLFGVGNGGNTLELDTAQELEILAKNYKSELKYRGGNAPVAINVYDPKRVAKADFNLKLSSRLTFYVDSTSGISFDTEGNLQGLAVGDTLIAGPLPTRNTTPAFPTRLSFFDQIPGVARINRIVSTDAPLDDPRRLIVLDIEMLNDEFGGTFEAQLDSLIQTINPDDENDIRRPFIQYFTIPLSFSKAGGSVTGQTVTFGLNDLWKLTITPENQPSTVVYSERPISDFNEQLIPEYGLSLQLKGALDPGNQVENNRDGGVQEGSSIAYSGEPWLASVSSDSVAWLSDAEFTIADYDPAGAYSRLLNGAWVPYDITNTYVLGGPRYHFLAPRPTITDLPNVNIVMTNDKSKWTKVVVLQSEIYAPCIGQDSLGTNTPISAQRFLKSTVPSVDQDGKPTGAISPYPGVNGNPLPSTGIGWFPGYAVDIDRGVRINLMFSESRFRANGNDLMWDPTTEANGGLSAIYLLNSVYDEGKTIERLYDSLMTLPAYVSTAPVGTPQYNCITKSPTKFAEAVAATIFPNVNWVGNMRLARGASKLQSEARIQLRVNRQYRSYSTPDVARNSVNDNPEYAFDTYGTAMSTGNVAVATSALDLIRVVPNPYYAYSDYEQRVTDNTVKITNLPPRATISIFNLNGTLIQTLQKTDPNLTFMEWNLKNRENLSIASGVYIIHVKADLKDQNGNVSQEEKVVKFFAILRPIDLQSF